MSANAIGTGAVVLTANADALLDGLNSAEKATTKFAKDTAGKATAAGKASGGGGIFGALLFGGAAGGAAGLAMAGVGVALAGVTKMADTLLGLPGTAKGIRDAMGQIRLRPGQLAPPTNKIDSAVESCERIESVATQIGGKILGAFAPALQTAADLVDALFVRLEPIIDSIGERFGSMGKTYVGVLGNVLNVAASLFEAVWPILDRVLKVIDTIAFIGGAVFGEITTIITDIITGITDWIGSMIDLSAVSMTTGEVVFKVARYIGYGFAYAWDTLKAGAGAMAYVASFIVDGFAQIVDAFKDTIKDLLNLAGQLPDEFGGDKFREWANSVDAWPAKIKAAAAAMKEWGKGTFGNFGKSLEDVDKWFDKKGKDWGKQSEFRAAAPREVKLSGAATRGSVEAASILARFEAGNIVSGQASEANNPVKIAKDQLKEIRDLKRGINKLVDRTERTVPLEILP